MIYLAQVNNKVTQNPISLSVKFENESKTARIVMAPSGRPVFTRELLEELIQAQKSVVEMNYDFIVLSSDVDGVFNYGGDLVLFQNLIKMNDQEGLIEYMKLCLSALYYEELNQNNIHRIAVVQGAALGGGFESALCCDMIIAEDSAVFGFPESLFNLFPGMGAYSYLIRRTTPSIAKNIIMSGKRYTAKELHEIGIIDKVVPDDEGYKASVDYIKNYRRGMNGFNAINALPAMINPLHYSELYNVGLHWVNTAMNLSKRDLKLMEKLGRQQSK